jgi:hypothetical protein
LGAAIDYLSNFGMQRIHEYEVSFNSFIIVSPPFNIFFETLLVFLFVLRIVHIVLSKKSCKFIPMLLPHLSFCAIQKELGAYLYESLLSVPKVRVYGPAPSQSDHRAPLCSFNVENVHPTDIAEILDLQVC